MGGTSAYKAMEILDNSEFIFAIELMTAAQAAECADALELSSNTRAIYDEFRKSVSFLEENRLIHEDIFGPRDENIVTTNSHMNTVWNIDLQVDRNGSAVSLAASQYCWASACWHYRRCCSRRST